MLRQQNTRNRKKHFYCKIYRKKGVEDNIKKVEKGNIFNSRVL